MSHIERKLIHINVHGTWLTSPSAMNGDVLMCVVYDGNNVNNCNYSNDYMCARPLVHLKSDIKLKQNETTGVWEKQE